MKKVTATLILLACCLPACSLVGQSPTQSQSAQETQQAMDANIATRVESTQVASVEQTSVAPTLTPTPGTLLLSEALLGGDEMNELSDSWPAAPDEQLNLSEDPLCVSDCAGSLWRSSDGSSRLVFQLYQATGRDQAVTLLQEQRRADGESGYEELPIPAIASLPPETWMILDTDKGEFVLWSRQGKAMIEVRLLFSQLDQDQNLLFLSLYAERQIEKLKISGF